VPAPVPAPATEPAPEPAPTRPEAGLRKVAALAYRPVNGGVAEGYALCCPESITGWAGVDYRSGAIIENGHRHRGESIRGRVLVVPGGKGSTGWSCHFYATKLAGTAPAGWVLSRMDTRVGVAMVMMGSPAVCADGADPFAVVQDGDYLRLDGGSGIVEVYRP
jgi:predicted aconitase with swiveling domain